MRTAEATIAHLGEAARTLFYRHGAGNILETRIYMDGRVEVHAKRYGARPHVVRGRIRGNTVHLLGHQMTPTSQK